MYILFLTKIRILWLLSADIFYAIILEMSEEFSEEEISDYEYEEVELDSEEDFDPTDEYLLHHASIVHQHPKNFVYRDGWSEQPPQEIAESFQPNIPNVPFPNYTMDQAFLAFMSPGIVKK